MSYSAAAFIPDGKPLFFLCSIDGNIVGDREQHDVHHREVQQRHDANRKLAGAYMAHRFGGIDKEEQTFAALNDATDEWLAAHE